MTRTVTWVIGAGGLLGSSVARVARSRGELWSPAVPVPWGTPEAGGVLRSHLAAFADTVDGAWRIAWCAGAGVTATGAASLAAEERVFADFCADLAAGMLSTRDGGLFLASSAGALYAGASGPPFTERSEPQPLADYGHSKLRMEAIASRACQELGLGLVIGRIGNLYGPGQDLAKAQGLVSHLCRSAVQRSPLHLFVPLDTVRDYLYADDAGAMVIDLLDRLDHATHRSGPGVHLKVMSSGHGVTVGFVLAEVARVVRRRPDVVFGASPQSRWQAPDLRLRSTTWTQVDRRMLTPMPVGIARTLQATRLRLQEGRLG